MSWWQDEEDESEKRVKAMITAACAVALSTIVFLLPLVIPGQIVYGALAAVAVYLFNRLPLHHYWNPIVRELYPYRQWKIERLAMRLLHWTHIIATSRLTSCSSRIPPEIWALILDHAIDAPFCFDTACEPKYFAQFIRAQTSSVQGWEYRESEEDRRRLRVVCKLWSSLLSKRTMRWLASKRGLDRVGTGLIRVDLPLDGIKFSQVHYEEIMRSIVACKRQFRALTILTLNGYRRNSTDALQSLMEACHDNQLKRITAFSMDGGRITVIPAECLREIQVSFSHLRYLRLDGDIVYRGITLLELEILYLDVQLAKPLGWSLPSLRHLALGERFFPTGLFDFNQIPAGSENLLSLLLLQRHSTVVMADNHFWSKLASLQFLGVRLELLNLVEQPPLSHPLSHLYLTDSSSRWNSPLGAAGLRVLHIERVMSVISSLPHVKFVTLPTIRKGRKGRCPDEWQALFRLHRARGITWLDDKGNAVDALKRPEQRTAKWWEKGVGDIWVYYCGIAGILQLWYSPLLLYTPVWVTAYAYLIWIYYDMYLS